MTPSPTPSFVIDADGVGTITFDDPDRSLNVLTEAVMLRFGEALDEARAAARTGADEGARHPERKAGVVHRRCGHRCHRLARGSGTRRRDDPGRTEHLRRHRLTPRPDGRCDPRRLRGRRGGDGARLRLPGPDGLGPHDDEPPRGAAGHPACVGRHHAAPPTRRPPGGARHAAHREEGPGPEGTPYRTRLGSRAGGEPRRGRPYPPGLAGRRGRTALHPPLPPDARPRRHASGACARAADRAEEGPGDDGRPLPRPAPHPRHPGRAPGGSRRSEPRRGSPRGSPAARLPGVQEPRARLPHARGGPKRLGAGAPVRFGNARRATDGPDGGGPGRRCHGGWDRPARGIARHRRLHEGHPARRRDRRPPARAGALRQVRGASPDGASRGGPGPGAHLGRARIPRALLRRPRRRGHRRAHGREAGRAARDGGARLTSLRHRDQHVVSLRERDGRRARAPRALLRDALLQPRAPDAARRGDPGGADVGRSGRDRLPPRGRAREGAGRRRRTGPASS